MRWNLGQRGSGVEWRLAERFGGIVQLAEVPALGRAHFRVAKEVQLLKTIVLELSCKLYYFGQLAESADGSSSTSLSLSIGETSAKTSTR